MEIEIKFKDFLKNPKSVAKVARTILKAECLIDQDKEHFWVFGLNGRGKIKYIELVSLGTMTSSLVHAREVFRFAIMKGTVSIVLVHNHPSGDPEPSGDDLEITSKLRSSGEILGIKVLDHVVIGDNSHYSFGGHGLI